MISSIFHSLERLWGRAMINSCTFSIFRETLFEYFQVAYCLMWGFILSGISLNWLIGQLKKRFLSSANMLGDECFRTNCKVNSFTIRIKNRSLREESWDTPSNVSFKNDDSSLIYNDKPMLVCIPLDQLEIHFNIIFIIRERSTI